MAPEAAAVEVGVGGALPPDRDGVAEAVRVELLVRVEDALGVTVLVELAERLEPDADADAELLPEADALAEALKVGNGEALPEPEALAEAEADAL